MTQWGGDAPTPAGGSFSGGGGGGGLGGNGGTGFGDNSGGGGGGGGFLSGDNGGNGATGGVGGAAGANGGGAGASTAIAAGVGTYGGGGGGACADNNAAGVSAAGGYGGGGGGGSSRASNKNGSSGGFGAGGGGGGSSSGTGGGTLFGGGIGGNGVGNAGAAGGGGAALGSAVFTDNTSSATILTNVDPFTGSTWTVGTGANPGLHLGDDIFLASGGSLTLNITGGTVPLANPIEAEPVPLLAGGGLIKLGTGTLNLTGLTNTYHGTTTIGDGILQFDNDNNLGNAATSVVLSGGTWEATTTFTSAKTVSITSASMISTPAGVDFTLTGVMSGASGYSKIGPGTFIPAAANVGYSGITSINNGTIRVSTDNQLGIGSLVLNGGTYETTASFPSPRPITITALNGTIQTTGGGTVLTQNGSINGPGTLTKTGLGTLILNGANGYGGTTLAAGTLNMSADNNLGTGPVTLQGGIFQPTASFSTAKNFAIVGPNPVTIDTPGGVNLSISGNLSGAFPMTKSGGGTLTLIGGNAYTGLTSLVAGALVLNNSSLGGVTMSPGTLLEGTGTLNGNLINNDGTVSPGGGAALGTLTVMGNFIQTAGGVYLVNIAPGGGADLILNIGGTATLAGTLDLQPLPGVYMEGTTYLILDATGGLGGTEFDNLVETHPLTFNTIYTPTQVFISIPKSTTVLPAPPPNLKGNAEAFINYLFCDDGSYMPMEPDIIYVLENLTKLSPEDFVEEVELLTPQQFRGLSLTGLQNSMKVGQTILSNLNSYDFGFQEKCRDQKLHDGVLHDAWFQPLGYYYLQHKRENETGFDSRTYGFSGGTNLVFGDHLTLGVGASYLYSNLHWNRNAGMAKMYTVSFGSALGWIEDNWFANFLALCGKTFYDVDRTIRFGNINRIAHNDHKSWDFQGTFAGGYRYQVPSSFLHNFYLQPEASVSVVAIIESGFQERGAQSLNLDVASKHSSFLRTEIDLRMIKDIRLKNLCISPSLRVGWLLDVSLQNGKYRSTLYGIDSCQPYFITQTNTKATNQLVLGSEVVISPRDHLSFELKYEANIGSRSAIQEGTARLQWDF